jgi:hypothetical protein
MRPPGHGMNVRKISSLLVEAWLWVTRLLDGIVTLARKRCRPRSHCGRSADANVVRLARDPDSFGNADRLATLR